MNVSHITRNCEQCGRNWALFDKKIHFIINSDGLIRFICDPCWQFKDLAKLVR